MSDNQEALKLAEILLSRAVMTTDQRVSAAAELRRLHAENESLREANEAFAKRQEWWNRRMLEQEQRYWELLKVMADAKAMQMPPIHIDADLVPLHAINTELMKALREIEWSNDTEWQRDRARAALAKVEASK